MKQVFYVPDRGDVVRISRPAHGAGGGKARPVAGPLRNLEAVVLSPQVYNERTGLALACPIIGRATGYPFEVEIPADSPVKAGRVALADRTFSFDWRALRAERIHLLRPSVVEEALGKIRALLA